VRACMPVCVFFSRHCMCEYSGVRASCVHMRVCACICSCLSASDRFTDDRLPMLCSCYGSVGIVWEHNRNQLEVWLPDCLGRNLLCMPAAMPLFTGIQIGRANHTLPQALSWEGQYNCNPERLHTCDIEMFIYLILLVNIHI
jgi:hypothetical protein